MLPPSMLMHMLVSLGSQVRPEPPGRWGRNAAPLGSHGNRLGVGCAGSLARFFSFLQKLIKGLLGLKEIKTQQLAVSCWNQAHLPDTKETRCDKRCLFPHWDGPQRCSWHHWWKEGGSNVGPFGCDVSEQGEWRPGRQLRQGLRAFWCSLDDQDDDGND